MFGFGNKKTNDPLAPANSTSDDSQDNAKQSKDENITIRPGGAESGGGSLETGNSSGNSEINVERLKQVEKAIEQAQEKKTSQPQAPKPQPQQKPKPVEKPKKQAPAVQGPQVYGYKISPQIATNYKLIKRNAGKGDPTTGISCLYVFLDRVLKMHNK